MAYETIHGASLVRENLGGRGPSEYEYNNTDTPTAVAANGYITNAQALRMKPGDTLKYRQDGTMPPVLSTHMVLVINANGSADLSDGVITATTNSN